MTDSQSPPPAETEARPLLPPRSPAYRRFMTVPLVFALLLMLSAFGLVIAAWLGGSADGERVSIAFATGCPAEAGPLLLARAAEVGLGEPALDATGSGLLLTATLPGLEDDRQAIPVLLAHPGRLSIRSGAEELASDADLKVAQVRLDEGGLPYTWIELEPEALGRVTAAVDGDPEGSLDILIDEALVATRPNDVKVTDGGLRIIDVGEIHTRERMRRAVDRSIVLSHGPLPCPVSVEGVQAVADGGRQR